MKCVHCKDTGKYKQPNNKERFEKLIDVENNWNSKHLCLLIFLIKILLIIFG